MCGFAYPVRAVGLYRQTPTHTKRMDMKQMIVLLVAGTVLLFSCGKDPVVQPGPNPPPPVNPAMRYIDFDNYSVSYYNRALVMDLDEDGYFDAFFDVQLVGDPIAKVDKMQWLLVTDLHVRLAMNAQEESPVKRRSDVLPVDDFDGYEWYGLTELNLFERVETAAGNVSWRGNWRQAVRQYLPVQIIINSKRYNGWFEITADIPGERMIVHRAAISKEPEKPVRAGL